MNAEVVVVGGVKAGKAALGGEGQLECQNRARDVVLSAAAASATLQSIISRPMSRAVATIDAVSSCSRELSAATVRPIWVVMPVITAALLRCTCTPYGW